jgi:hypothetical protein
MTRQAFFCFANHDILHHWPMSTVDIEGWICTTAQGMKPHFPRATAIKRFGR